MHARMAHTNNSQKNNSAIDEKYLEFVKERARTQNYHAEEKLTSIDELAEMIFIARSNYRKSLGAPK